MKKILLSVGILGVFGNATAQTASAFGIQRGLPIQKLIAMGAVYDKENNRYQLKKVPTPNPAFEYYFVRATDKLGVCAITGIGADINTNEFGDAVKSKFASLKSALQSKYGSSKDYNFLHAKSIWDEDKYWMRSLEQEERTLSSFWDREERSNLPAGLSGISLTAGAVTAKIGFINLRYEFDNYQACKAEFEKTNNDGL